MCVSTGKPAGCRWMTYREIAVQSQMMTKNSIFVFLQIQLVWLFNLSVVKF